jgi:hypothetical protein
MSELPPIPEHDDYRGFGRAKNGDVGVIFRSHVGEEYLLSERAMHKDVLKAAEWSRDLRFTLPNWSAFYAEASDRSRHVLAQLQSAKLRHGIKLDVILTPHLDVRLPDPDDPSPSAD